MRQIFASLAVAIALVISGNAVAKAPVKRHAGPAAPAKTPSGPPKLLVAIAVDQFSADLFAQYRQYYHAGMARLMQGAVFPSAFQSHSATETCPGHSTLLTGVHPARTGIIANNWYDFTQTRVDKRVYCAEDEKDPNSTSKEPIVSAVHLRVPTLGERMKAQWPASRNVGVSGKNRAVMMMGGQQIDAGYWWETRGFGTLNGRALGLALDENGAILATVGRGAPALLPPAWCQARDRAVEVDKLTVGQGRFALEPDQFDEFRISPRLDAVTLDLAAKLVADMKLGKGAAPDMLSISLSATDYVGHAFGHEGMEMCIQMNELDKALGVFFTKLDAAGIDYAVVLTADHGGLDVPERLELQGLPSATRADKSLTSPCLSEAIAQKLGLKDFIPAVSNCGPAVPPAVPPPQLVYSESAFGEYYVIRSLPADVRVQVAAELAALLKQSPQVETVFTHDELVAAPMPSGSPQDWSLTERARASFDAERSGDVFSVLKRAVVPIPFPAAGYTATHGSPWDYDRRVPLLFWRRGVAGLEQPAPVETVDIAPTLAALIGLKVPAGQFDGRCLDIDGSAANSCADGQHGAN
jgi:predicted AlkP superfamily pyrophosphatase or phosphodiesterase